MPNSNKKKLLILIEWFSPGYKAGGPIQSCVNMCIALKESYAIYVLTTDTDHGETMPYTDVTVNEWGLHNDVGVQVFYMEKQKASYQQLAYQIKQIDADFVCINLLFSPMFALYPLWLKHTKKINGQLVISPRGSLYDSAISLKWYKKKPLLFILKSLGFYRQVIFHATNKREKEAVLKYFPNNKIGIADNLPDILLPPFVSNEKTAGSLRCIFVARIVPIKNLLFLIELLAAVQQTVTLTIVGPIENEAYWLACEKAIEKLPAHITINYIGAKKNAELLGLLQQHHLFVLPTTGENFGHAIFESFRAGRPVLISDQTPWVNLAQQGIGWDLPLTDKPAFINALEAAAAWNQEQYDSFALAAYTYASNFIHNPSLIQPYHQLFL